MTEFYNLDGKRVCDISEDKRYAEIARKGCITRISANPDSTIRVENIALAPEKGKSAV